MKLGIRGDPGVTFSSPAGWGIGNGEWSPARAGTGRDAPPPTTHQPHATTVPTALLQKGFRKQCPGADWIKA